MSDQFSSDEEVLARLVREAGDPNVSPDPQYAQTLRSTILDRVGPAETAANVSPIISVERTRKMKRIAKFTVAATILVALGISVSWMTIGGGSTNIAFAEVAKALDNLRSATFDMTSEVKGEKGQPPVTATGKGFFLAPSHERIETSVDLTYNPAVKAAAAAARRVHAADSQAAKAAAEAAAKSVAEAFALMPKRKMTVVMITDRQAAKTITLMPNMKIAIVRDEKKMYEEMKKSAGGPPPDLFEMVRRIVREGSSGTGEKAKPLGKKEIDGHEAVGFWVHNAIDGMGDMTLWADPETAWPIRIEVVMDVMAGGRVVMNNFRYNVDLDPSLFSLEPPAGYSTQTMEMTVPVEEDLLGTLRTIAEHSKGLFPAKLGMNKEVMELLMAGSEPKIDELTADKMEAEMNKIAAKYGGKDELKAKYGKDIPPEIMAEFMKATAPIMQEQMQEQAQERMQKQMPLAQKRMRGITFYTALNPENDAHYTGGGVKLGTPDRPIFWYKPTGAENYRVIYADLSVREADTPPSMPDAQPLPAPSSPKK